ncbi:hypothetical protein FD28_GL002333 [Levilactobacillus hammesii DSM 16381]|uniref:Uncharacterized protein n=1 Tax=Levilactobacillus hammesii DSM 16381 TaxID=1423753 RepID=A0A0R1UUN5_9LACO|nr:hypothetical protein FD28_GL002333 [Levilactobacillus hammesii DSM 16381]
MRAQLEASKTTSLQAWPSAKPAEKHRRLSRTTRLSPYLPTSRLNVVHVSNEAQPTDQTRFTIVPA